MALNNLLIASGGFINPNLYGDLGKIYTSHLPISGRLAVTELIKKSIDNFDNIFVILDSTSVDLGNYLKWKYRCEIVWGSAEFGLDKALFKAISKLPKNLQSLSVLFGDSYNTDLLNFNPQEEDIIFVSKTLDYLPWKQIERDFNSNNLIFKSDKECVENKFRVTGSFIIQNISLFLNTWNKILEVQSISDSFWQTWINYDCLQRFKTKLVNDHSWRDLGHIDNYFFARRENIFTTSRNFNSIKLNDDLSRVIKTGTAEKIELEISWFNDLPTTLRKYVPNIYTNKSNNSYEIDYSLVIPLNEMWISENEDDSYWHLFANALGNLLEDFHSIRLSNISQEKIVSLKRNFYLNKLRERIDLFQKSNLFQFSDSENIFLNSEKLPSINGVIEEVSKLVDRISLNNHWSIIHGDLCFSNMFYDRRKNQIKLIDPRGSFGQDGIEGDPLYDLVKLSHSIHGNYDYFACDLYTLEEKENEYLLNIASPKRELLSRKILGNLLTRQVNKLGIDFRDLRLLESTLFLSAAALHTENDRGKALFLHGLQIAKENLLE